MARTKLEILSGYIYNQNDTDRIEIDAHNRPYILEEGFGRVYLPKKGGYNYSIDN